MRLHGLDSARFLAFCGMVLVNFRLAAEVPPSTDWAAVLISGLEGRAAALFVVLAGIGVSLAKAPSVLMLRRAAFLFVIGLANLTIFEADILHFYALYFVASVPFVTASNRALWWGIAGVMFVSLSAQVGLDYEAGWNWETLAYADFWTVTGFLRHSIYNGWHPVFPWLSFLLLGIWIGRLELRAAAVQRRMVIWGALAGAVALVPARLWPDPQLVDLINTTSIPPGPFYILAGSGTAVAVIGLVLSAQPALAHLRLSEWLAAPGRQSLTLYGAHILIGMGALEAIGRLDGSLTSLQILVIGLGFCAFCSLYARLWARMFKRGPLEAVMRWSTEMKP